uniref:Uncharacterized protein n=1 Tax=Candidatus Kentrum sp. LPFa TaxID=2126335 RepID=A0A450VXX4_9GAMM|nr:MAG: hypothetical protein BECKLPF1236B_GA0070989_10106 [Candidatus Kentron sp. LPFa]
MFDNETIDEIRATRKQISARFGHSPKRLIEHYKEKQKTRVQSRHRIESGQQATWPNAAHTPPQQGAGG